MLTRIGPPGWRSTTFLVLVLATSAATPEPAPFPTLAAIDFEGRHVLSAAAAQDALGWREGSPFDVGTVRDAISRLLDAYRATGHVFAEVASPDVTVDDGAAHVRLRIEEGPRARLDAVDFEGLAMFDEDKARRALDVRLGRPFDADRWQRGLRRVLHEYATRGRPLAVLRTEVRAADPATGSVQLALHVEEGPTVTIERVDFEGLAKTREAFLRRLIPVRVGDTYDERRIEEARHLIRNSGYFKSIHPSDVQRGSQPDLVVYRLRVEEARTARIAGVLGYAPPQTDADAPQVTGLIEASERNLFGTGRQIELLWESADNRTTHAAYREPFLFGGPVSATLRWDAERFEDLSEWTGLARADWSASPYIRLGAGGQVLHTDLGEAWGAVVDVEYDSRDYRPNPTRGRRLRLGAEAYAGTPRFRRVDLEAAAYVPLTRRHVLAARAAIARLFGDQDDIPATQWYFVGGAATLRGYREREFRGTRRLLAGVEYRILTGPESHAFLFLDLGEVRTETSRIGPRVGYGIGVNLVSRGGLIRVQYGLAPGTPLVDGKLHLRLGTAF